jgi:hypothetical protein
MDLDSFLIERYVIVDDWVQLQADRRSAGRGRPARLSLSEVLMLAIFQQWPRWRSGRDFGRWADCHLRLWFPQLVGQSQLNRRIRRASPQLAALQQALAAERIHADADFCRGGRLWPLRQQDRLGLRMYAWPHRRPGRRHHHLRRGADLQRPNGR